MTVEARSLLPDASGPFERAISATNAGRLAPQLLLIALVRTLWNPWTIPERHLDLLAWAFSVDVWNAAWPIERRRQVVAEARAFHRAKTTVKGFRMALGYVDAALVRAHLPRDGFFAGRAPTEAEQEAWLATLPEIRIYTNAPKTRPGRKGFLCGRTPVRDARRIVLDLRRAELRRQGTITPLIFSGVTQDASGRLLSEPERLLIPGPAAGRMRAGSRLGAPVSDGRAAGLRVLPLSFTRGGDRTLPGVISTTLLPVDIAPRQVAEPRPAGLGLFAGRPRRGRGVRPNDADGAFYAAIRLADGGIPTLARMRNVVGKTRLRRERFTASLLVHVPRDPLRSAYAPGRVARAAPTALVQQIESAIAVTQAARDTLFLDLNSTRPLTYSDLARVGEQARFGVAVRR